MANSDNDPDDAFAPGGRFSTAFAFEGGRFVVSPSGRPASTFAHEIGHIFWAFDEYSGGDGYLERRGYYDTQNLNAANNPAPGFTQVPSIMANNSLRATAYANHTSSPSSLEMIGWKDSDGDGIFDVLDVPLALEGSGFYDAPAGVYRFQGRSVVQTLPNRNPSGLQNDITINRIRKVEYRIDGGAWQLAQTRERPRPSSTWPSRSRPPSSPSRSAPSTTSPASRQPCSRGDRPNRARPCRPASPASRRDSNGDGVLTGTENVGVAGATVPCWTATANP